MARAMGTNAYGEERRRGERTLSRGFTHRRARRAFLRPYGAGASLGRSHRAYALGYFLVPLTGLRTAHAQDWPDAKNSASRRRRGLKCRNSRAGGPRGYPAGHARFLAGIWSFYILLVTFMGISRGGARESSPWREPWEQTRTARSPGGAKEPFHGDSPIAGHEGPSYAPTGLAYLWAGPTGPTPWAIF